MFSMETAARTHATNFQGYFPWRGRLMAPQMVGGGKMGMQVVEIHSEES